MGPCWRVPSHCPLLGSAIAPWASRGSHRLITCATVVRGEALAALREHHGNTSSHLYILAFSSLMSATTGLTTSRAHCR